MAFARFILPILMATGLKSIMTFKEAKFCLLAMNTTT